MLIYHESSSLDPAFGKKDFWHSCLLCSSRLWAQLLGHIASAQVFQILFALYPLEDRGVCSIHSIALTWLTHQALKPGLFSSHKLLYSTVGKYLYDTRDKLRSGSSCSSVVWHTLSVCSKLDKYPTCLRSTFDPGQSILWHFPWG